MVPVVAECPELEDIGLGGVRTVGKFCQACKVIHRDRLSLGSGADEGRWMPERLACVFGKKCSAHFASSDKKWEGTSWTRGGGSRIVQYPTANNP